MGELSRMMDSLENMNNTATNNYTGFFTNSMGNTNSNTYHLMNSANNINFNVTADGGVNNSRLNNPSVSQNQPQAFLNRSGLPRQNLNAQNISDHNISPVNYSDNLQVNSQFSQFLPHENSNNDNNSRG